MEQQRTVSPFKSMQVNCLNVQTGPAKFSKATVYQNHQVEITIKSDDNQCDTTTNLPNATSMQAVPKTMRSNHAC